MVNFFLLAFVASALSLAVAGSQKPSGAPESIIAALSGPVPQSLQPSTGLLFGNSAPTVVSAKRNLIDLPTSIISQIFPQRTRKPPQSATARFSYKRIRVHAYLSDTLNAILLHTTTIRKICAGADNADAEKLSWRLVTELRAILQILKGSLYNVQNCGKAPTPSGAPGASPPTLDDICHIFFKIMCEIRECFKLIGSLCIKYKVVRLVCQDTLKQTISCLSSIAIRCGAEVGDLSIGLGHLFATIPHFFVDVQFGFSAFPSVLADGYGSFSFNSST